MEQVWDERVQVGTYSHGYIRNNYYSNHRDELDRYDYDIYANTEAHWDPATGVLCIDQHGYSTADGAFDWVPTERRVLLTVKVREAMLREVMRLTDEWAGVVKATIPASLTDDEVWAARRAERQQAEDRGDLPF